MDYPLNRERIAQGVSFSSITDKKFKYNRMSVNLIVPLERDRLPIARLFPLSFDREASAAPILPN